MAASLQEVAGPPIQINCPVCGGKSIPAAVLGWDHLLLHAVPIYRAIYVRCSICLAKCRVVRAKIDQLALLDADQIDRYLIPPAGRAGSVRAVVALIISCVPVAGLYFAWRAYQQNRGTHGIAIAASIAALVVATLANLTVLISLVMIPVVLMLKR
jgi:hypothetical protein